MNLPAFATKAAEVAGTGAVVGASAMVAAGHLVVGVARLVGRRLPSLPSDRFGRF